MGPGTAIFMWDCRGESANLTHYLKLLTCVKSGQKLVRIELHVQFVNIKLF